MLIYATFATPPRDVQQFYVFPGAYPLKGCVAYADVDSTRNESGGVGKASSTSFPSIHRRVSCGLCTFPSPLTGWLCYLGCCKL